MDPYLTACTGMDALTHAIEAYVSNTHSALTDVHALEAIKLLSQGLEKAILPDRTLETMFHVMHGSLQAGMAFSNASLGAVHAMSHSLGGLLDLPHGECNSILLEHIIRINYHSVPTRFRTIARQLGIAVDDQPDEVLLERIISRIVSLRTHLSIPAAIAVEKLDDTMLDYLVENALHDPCMVTNPKVLTKDEVKSIYERVLHPQK
jgi:alcohol dehydrogenase class IV